MHLRGCFFLAMESENVTYSPQDSPFFPDGKKCSFYLFIYNIRRVLFFQLALPIQVWGLNGVSVQG